MKLHEILSFNKQYKMVIYGESHFKSSEVKKIRNTIEKQKPNVVVHELDFEEQTAIKSYAPNAILLPLESSHIRDKKYSSLKDQFYHREKAMIDTLKRVYNRYDNIAVVVGDTHLRTIKTDKLGNKSPLVKFANSRSDVKIVRSKFPEIK